MSAAQTMKNVQPGSMRRLVLVALALGAALPVAAQSGRPDVPSILDPYGYLVVDQQDPRCAFDFVDISVGGDPVQFSGGGADPEDEGGALVVLDDAFELYGAAVTSFVVSANGYLAVASSLADEDGGDFSNDARLPAIPDNPPASPARLLPYHDDLTGSPAGGAASSRHFADCPRPSEALGSEACTVVQWSDWSSSPVGEPFALQAILYHQSFQIAFQIRPGPSGLAGGTIGIQNAAARLASQYGGPGLVLAADTAVCFFDPRHPPGGPVADLMLIKTDKVDEVNAGETLIYAVSVVNRGPSPVSGASVTDLLPAALADCSWTCEASAGSSCTAGGSGDIDDTVDVAPAGWVDYTLVCDAGQSDTRIANTPSVSAPPGVRDPDLDNDSATDVDVIVPRPRLACPEPAGGADLVWPGPHSDSVDLRCPQRQTARGAGRLR